MILANDNTKLARTVAGDGSELPARMTYGDHERGAIHAQKRRLAARATYGKEWDGKADNDNIAWPLAKALLAEGNGELLKYAMKYRKIYDMAKSEVSLGFKGSPAPDMAIVRKGGLDESTGRFVYGGELVLKSAPTDIPATMKAPTNPDSKKNAAPVPKPWNGDMELINSMDARGLLAHLQHRLGPLVDPFEMAVVDNATLRDVGHASGASSRDGAPAAGRAICHLGLITVRDALGKVNRADIAA